MMNTNVLAIYRLLLNHSQAQQEGKNIVIRSLDYYKIIEHHFAIGTESIIRAIPRKYTN